MTSLTFAKRVCARKLSAPGFSACAGLTLFEYMTWLMTNGRRAASRVHSKAPNSTKAGMRVSRATVRVLVAGRTTASSSTSRNSAIRL